MQISCQFSWTSRRCLTMSSITKICANCKVCSLLSFLDLSSITIIDWAMDFVVLIASLYNSSFKVSIFPKDSANFLKTNAMSPLNLCFLFPTTLLETPNKFVAHVWRDSIVILSRVPILDVLVEVPNARIVDGRDYGGTLPPWLGPVSSSSKSSSMFGAWEDPTWA